MIRTVVVSDYDALSQAAADSIAATLARKPDALLLLATGDTPMGAYRELAERRLRGELDTSQLRAAQLDEYAGLGGPDDRRSLYGWMERSFLEPLGVTAERAIRPRRLAPARRGVPRVRRRRRSGRRVRARRARPRPERPPRLQRAADRARRADAPRAADAGEHPQQRALLGGRGRRPAQGADLWHGGLLEARQILLVVVGPAQARDPAPHADAAAHGRRPGVVAATGLGRRRRPRRSRRLPRGLGSPLRYRRAVIEATTSEAGSRLDRDFTISLRRRVSRATAPAPPAASRRSSTRLRARGSASARSRAPGGYNGPGRRAARLVRDRRRQRAALVRPRAAVADLELRRATRSPSSTARSTPRPPTRRTRRIAATSTGTSARPHWEDLGQVGREGAHGVGPLIVHRDALYAATWNYDWTRVHDQDLAPCRVYRYDGPGRWEDCGQPGQLAADLQPRLLPRRPAARSATTPPSTPIAAERRGSRWRPVRHVRASGDRARRTARARHAPAGHRARRSTAATGTISATRSAIRSAATRSTRSSRSAARSTPARGRSAASPAGTPPPALAAGRAARRQHRGDGAERLQRQALRRRRSRAPRCSATSATARWTSLRRLFDPPGWRPVLVRNMGTPEGDRRTAEWTRVTSLTQHDGLVFASVGSCTSAAVDAPADVRGTVHAFGAGVVATTPRTLEPGRHHVAAVRRGGTLSIYVDGREAATAHGRRHRIDRDGRAAAHRRGRGRPLRRRDRRLPDLRPGARRREISAADALHITRRQRHEATGESAWSGPGWAAGAHLGAHSQIDGCEVVAVCTSREPVTRRVRRPRRPAARGRPRLRRR